MNRVRRISRGKSVVVGIVGALVLAVVVVAGTATAGRTADTTLTIWTYDNQDPGLKPVLTQLSKNFEKSHPGVKINILFKNFNQVLTTVGRALQSDSGPDLTQGNQGFQTDGALVKAKLILPLDKYAAKYNWVKLLGPGTTQQYRWSADGKKFGVGSTYGVAMTGQHVALFYNKAKLKQLGINPGTALSSLGGFQKALAAARAKLPADEPVLMLGNQNGYEAAWLIWSVIGAISNPQALRDWVYQKDGATINRAPALTGFGILQSWQKKGYFPADVNALQNATAAANFAKGSGVFFADGVWNAGIIKAGLKSAAGVAPMPPAKKGGAPSAIGSTSGSWHISAKSKNPDLAAEWLNYVVTSPAAIKLMHSQQQIPAVVTAPAPKGDPFLAALVTSWKQLSKANGLTLFEDWASPTMLQTVASQMQQLIAGKTTPKAAAEALQKDWDKFHKTLR
jgi:raffinose/stachyose/melibiose transport system substrate-binding protein